MRNQLDGFAGASDQGMVIVERGEHPVEAEKGTGKSWQDPEVEPG
jgi:hypothetical protein